MYKRHMCHACTLTLLLGSNVYAGDDIAPEKAVAPQENTTMQQENEQESATPGLTPQASLKHMSTFFDEFDKLFEQRMQDLNQEMAVIESKMQTIDTQPKQAPRFSITESPSKDGTHLVIKAHLPGFTREEIQVKFVTTEEQDAAISKMLEITAEHKATETPKVVKQTKTAKGHQVVSESVVRTHHVFASSSYANGRERKVSSEDGKVKIQYDLPDNVDLANLGAAKDADYMSLDNGVLSITLPVIKE